MTMEGCYSRMWFIDQYQFQWSRIIPTNQNHPIFNFNLAVSVLGKDDNTSLSVTNPREPTKGDVVTLMIFEVWGPDLSS